MSEIASIRPLAAVLVSALAVVLIVASYRRPNVREFWSVLAALVKFGLVASMIPGVVRGNEYYWSFEETFGHDFLLGIDFALRADALGMVFATLASFLWIFTAFYTAGYMRGLDEPNQTRFFAAFAASLSTAIGISFAENLLVIFIFYELLSVVTYPLVAHDEDGEARAAGRKYLAYTFFGGGFLVLGGTALVYWLTAVGGNATLTFGEMAGPLREAMDSGAVGEPVLQITFAMLALGFGTKAAIMPLHSWLPDAMVAPTPVSGLLHAVAVVKAGAFGVARVLLDVFEPELAREIGMHIPLAALAAFSFLAASFIALRKDHLKRRLAYSTASQLSYIIMGIALLTPYGIVGGLLHIPAHAFMKLTLFFCAGAIHVETHTDYVSEMAGIGKRMPLTLAAFAVAAAGMAGIPFIAGFVSKFYMIIGAMGMEATIAGIAFASALVVSGVLNIAYFWPVVYAAFFESEDAHDAKPLVEYPIGGQRREEIQPVAADGGSKEHNGDDHEDDQTGETDATEEPIDADSEAEDTTDDVPADYKEGPGPGGTEYAVDDRPSDTDVPFGADHDDDHGHHHHGGPEGGRWERRKPWTESTPLMLVPITVIVTGAVLLGIVPGSLAFLDLIVEVVDGLEEVAL